MTISTIVGEARAVHRLALAVQPVNAVTGHLAVGKVQVDREPSWVRPRHWDGRPHRSDRRVTLPRHQAGFVLTYGSGVRATEIVRITCPSQQFVPRRFSISVRPVDQIAASDEAEDPAPYVPASHRFLRPILLPGSAYRPSPGSTGAVLRLRHPDRTPVRWPRAHAYDALGGLIGWAHGDQYGQLLLLIPRGEWPPPQPGELRVAVRYFAPKKLPEKATIEADPLADLPLEELPDGDALPGGDTTDELLQGVTPPDDYDTALADEVVTLQYGQMLVERAHTFTPL